MAERPYTLLSCGMSIDGYLDGASEQRLLLSNEADFDRVDAVRAGCDAILVGAGTVRKRQPAAAGARRADRQAERVAAGLRPSPTKVTRHPAARQLDPRASFFATGDGDKLVYCASRRRRRRPRRGSGDVATVVDAGPTGDCAG